MDPTLPLYIGTPEDDQDTSSRDSQVLEGLSRAIQEISSFFSETDPSQQDGATLTSSASSHSNLAPELTVEQLQIFVDVNESLIHASSLTDSTSQQLDLLSCTTLLQGTSFNFAYPGSQTRHMNRSGPSAPPYYHSATSHINMCAPPYDFAATSLMDPYHRQHVNTAPWIACTGFQSSYIPYSPSPQLSGLMTSTSSYQSSPQALSPAWHMALQEVNTCENLPLPHLQNCIVSYPGSAHGGLQDHAVDCERDSIHNEEDAVGMESDWIISRRLDINRGSENKETGVTHTNAKKRYSEANSTKAQIDGTRTETSEPTSKKQKLEELSCHSSSKARGLKGSNSLDMAIYPAANVPSPGIKYLLPDTAMLFKPGLTTSMDGGNVSTSTIQAPMDMDHWVQYEECVPAIGCTPNNVVSMLDRHVMDTSSGGTTTLDSHSCNQLLANVASTESSVFLHGLTRDSWMGFDSSLSTVDEMGTGSSFPINTITDTSSTGHTGEYPGVPVEYLDNKDSQPDSANPKCLTLQCNDRERHTKKAEEIEEANSDVFVLAPLNHTDPCSYFPTEVWFIVLKHLPLSVIANTSTVSILWLEGARSYRGWKVAAHIGKMGVPEEYYQTRPEQNRSPCNRQDSSTYHHNAMVTRVEAKERYGLSSKHLRRIKHRFQGSLRYYMEYEIQKKARKVHAGWVGVDAVLGNVQMDRRLQYQMRLTADRTRSPPMKRNAGNMKEVHVKGKEKVEARDTSAGLVPAQHASCGEDLWNLSTGSWHDPFDVTPLWIGTFSDLEHKDESEFGQGIGSGFWAL
ncbi:hypothetical protein BG000_005948 [Podila horticola]|nr:hypothetical protein BG000_005948 [Podila horticola]